MRWIVRGETGGILGLTLGADTWRVYSGYWVWFGLYLGFYIASVIVIAVAAGVLGAAGDMALTGIVVGVLALVISLAAIYFAVRLAPAAATSVAQGKFSFFKAWTVTRGRFWSLFGAFALLIVLYFVGSADFVHRRGWRDWCDRGAHVGPVGRFTDAGTSVFFAWRGFNIADRLDRALGRSMASISRSRRCFMSPSSESMRVRRWLRGKRENSRRNVFLNA